MSRYYLTVDLGTGNSRVALISSEGEIIGMKSFVNRYYRDSQYEDAQYFLPEEWQDTILNCCAALCTEHPEIRIDAITSAGARQSIVLFDRECTAIIGLPNIDNRGREYIKEIPGKETIYKQSGRWGTGCFPAINLMAYFRKNPEQFARVGKITSISEWIASIFTGNIVMEHSQACETQLYDIERREWSEKLCRFYGLNPDILPKLQSAGTPAGTILSEYRKMLHSSAHTIFLVGGADTQIAVKQAGAVTRDIVIVSGTTSPVVTIVDDYFYDELESVWTNVNLGGETYLLEMNPGVTGLNYQRLKNSLFADWSYKQLEAAYEQKNDFTCTASFSSMLFYEKRSLRNGGFFMKSPLDASFDPVDLLWAVLADIACSVYEQFRRLCDLMKNKDPFVLGCGGGFRSANLCRMVADLTGRKLILYPGFEQATVIGLASICNSYFSEKPILENGAPLEYYPRENQLIHRYYPVWLANRTRANPADD